MRAIDPDVDIIVTDHCALRFLERVLEVEIGTISPHGESKRLNRLCSDLGVTVLALKASILSPAVRAALDAGADKVLHTGVWFAFAHGRVTTVVTNAMRYARNQDGQGHKLKIVPLFPARRRRPREAVSHFWEEGL